MCAGGRASLPALSEAILLGYGPAAEAHACPNWAPRPFAVQLGQARAPSMRRAEATRTLTGQAARRRTRRDRRRSQPSRASSY